MKWFFSLSASLLHFIVSQYSISLQIICRHENPSTREKWKKSRKKKRQTDEEEKYSIDMVCWLKEYSRIEETKSAKYLTHVYLCVATGMNLILWQSQFVFISERARTKRNLKNSFALHFILVWEINAAWIET